mgnify:CR=1 FL=1
MPKIEISPNRDHGQPANISSNCLKLLNFSLFVKYPCFCVLCSIIAGFQRSEDSGFSEIFENARIVSEIYNMD